MNTATMIAEYYHPETLTKEEIEKIEELVAEAVVDPESAEGCAVRAYLAGLCIANHDCNTEYLLHSTYCFCDGWDAAMRLKGGRLDDRRSK